MFTLKENGKDTIMHSSRMRTARCLRTWGLCLGGAGGLCSGDLFPKDLCHLGPIPCGQIDACENITLPQTSFAGSKNSLIILIRHS